MNLNHYHWLIAYERANEIPRDGAWEDVSGQTFLRTLLSMPIGPAKYDVGRPAMCASREWKQRWTESLVQVSSQPLPRKETRFMSFFSFLSTFLSHSLTHPLFSPPLLSLSSFKTPDDHVKGMGVDPRSMAQRIMDIRSQLAKEWIEDLADVSEENALLLRETAAASLRMTTAEHPFDSSTDEEEGGSESDGGSGAEEED